MVAFLINVYVRSIRLEYSECSSRIFPYYWLPEILDNGTHIAAALATNARIEMHRIERKIFVCSLVYQVSRENKSYTNPVQKTTEMKK